MAEELTDAELAARLRLAIGRIQRRIRQQMPDSLTVGQTSALASVEQREPIRLSDLAIAEGVSVPTLSRLVTGLETLGLIARKPDPDDGRASQITITDAGRERLDHIRTERSAYLLEQVGDLSADHRAALQQALDALETLAGTAQPATTGS